jgi:hypothetical protein
MPFEVAIPSYQRAQTLTRKTLHTLLRGGIDPATITVFVADAGEYDTYAATLVPGTYGQVVVGQPTLQGARAFIQTYYPEGTPVLNVDDDVSGLLQAVTPQHLQPVQDLVALVEEAFHLARSHGVALWGVYPVANPYFMQETITFDLRYIVGAFWGVIATHDPAVRVTLEDKEDFERSILFYLRDGAVMRLNTVCVETQYYTEPGGMQVTRTPRRVTAAAQTLLRRFPLLCQWNTRTKRAQAEITLRDRRPRGVASG